MVEGEKLKDCNVSKALLDQQTITNEDAPRRGVLLKAYGTGKLTHVALFDATPYNITNKQASPNTPIPEHLNANLHPLRQIVVPSAALRKGSTIDVADIEVLTINDLCLSAQNETPAQIGYGKIKQSAGATGKVIVIWEISYKNGADNKDKYWRKVRTHNSKELTIPVSYLNQSSNRPHLLDNTSLPTGTTVSFSYGMEVSSGKPFAYNISRVTLLNTCNTYGKPAQRLQSTVRLQPNGYNVDLHVHPAPITLLDNRCALLKKHLSEITTDAEHVVRIIFQDGVLANNLNEVTIGDLGRYIKAAHHQHWHEVSLDVLAQAYLGVKMNAALNAAHLKHSLQITFIFPLTNQNFLNLATQQIQNSYNRLCQSGHTHINKQIGVVVIFEPERHSPTGIVAQVNHNSLLSNTSCSALKSTHTHSKGYIIPYVHNHVSSNVTHTNLSFAVFADHAKDLPLTEHLIPQPEGEGKITPTFIGLIKLQYPYVDDTASHPILPTLQSTVFKNMTDIYYTGDFSKAEDKYVTVSLSPKPGYYHTVIAMLKSFPGVLVMPEPNMEDPGALIRSRVPYPKDITAMVNSPVVKYAQFFNPYTVRIIFNSGYGPESIPKLLKLQTTAAHSAENISLTSQTNTVWTEVITNNAHSSLGRSLPQFTATNTSTVFLSGFKGVTPAKWIQANIFQDNLPAHITIVDSKEETAGGGVFVQHLKPDKAAAMGLSGSETILSIYSANAQTYQSLEELSRHIDSLSHARHYSPSYGRSSISYPTC